MKVQREKTSLSKMQFFAWAQSKQKDSVRTGDLVKAMKTSSKQEADLFYKLSSAGLILKLWRGFYLVPKKIPPGGKWTPSPYLIINKYMEEVGAKFQISGPVVFNSYGYSNQVAAEFTIYNDKVSKKTSFLQYRMNFVKVSSTRLGAVKKFRPYGDQKSEQAIFSSPEQALLDAVYDYKRYASLPKAYEWILTALKNKTADPNVLANLVVKYGNTMSKKRIGWLLEIYGAPKKITDRIKNKIPKTNFLVPLNPKNSNGSINKKWGVIENVELTL